MIDGLDIGLVDRAAGLIFLLLIFFSLRPEQGRAQKHRKQGKRSPAPGRDLFFDFAKGVAMVIVVGIHTNDAIPRGGLPDRMLWFALPLFVIASGYLLMRRYAADFDVRRFASNTFWRIVVPYIIYTIFAGLFIYPRANWTQILSDIVLGGQNNGSLFFIPLLLQLYVVFALLATWPALRRLMLHPITLALIFLLSYAISDADHSLRVARWNSHAESLIFAGRYLFYFMMGMWLAGSRMEKKSAWGLAAVLVLSIPLLLVAYDPLGWDQPFVYPIWAFLTLYLFYQALNKNTWASRPIGAFAAVGQYSLIIYMIHQTVIYNGLWQLRDLIPFGGWLRSDLIAVVAVVISYVLGKLLMDGYAKILKWGKTRIGARGCQMN